MAAKHLFPLGLATERGLPPPLVGLSLTAGALTWVAGSWFQDRAEGRGHHARGLRVQIGLGLVLVVTAGVAVVILSPSLPVWLAVLAWAAAGLGMGLAYPGSTLVAMADPNGQGGLGAASLLVAETIGIAAGAGAVGALVACRCTSISAWPTAWAGASRCPDLKFCWLSYPRSGWCRRAMRQRQGRARGATLSGRGQVRGRCSPPRPAWQVATFSLVNCSIDCSS